MTSLKPPAAKATRIAVVGDVHDQWEADDAAALQHLGVDLVLLVGDFGNEAVEVVRAIAALKLPKAVVLGNHDAWYSATEWGRKKCPYDRTLEDRVQQQLDLLGAAHIGYGKLELPQLNLSLIGGRPFSWGGSKWKHVSQFYQARYGIASLEASTAHLRSQVEQAEHEQLIFVGHCGPAGLGAARRPLRQRLESGGRRLWRSGSGSGDRLGSRNGQAGTARHLRPHASPPASQQRAAAPALSARSLWHCLSKRRQRTPHH